MFLCDAICCEELPVLSGLPACVLPHWCTVSSDILPALILPRWDDLKFILLPLSLLHVITTGLLHNFFLSPLDFVRSKYDAKQNPHPGIDALSPIDALNLFVCVAKLGPNYIDPVATPEKKVPLRRVFPAEDELTNMHSSEVDRLPARFNFQMRLFEAAKLGVEEFLSTKNLSDDATISAIVKFLWACSKLNMDIGWDLFGKITKLLGRLLGEMSVVNWSWMIEGVCR